MITAESPYHLVYLQEALGKQEELEQFEIARVQSRRDPRKAWLTYDSGASRYEEVFRAVRGRSFYDILEAQRQETGQCLAMDVMGTGGFGQVHPDVKEFDITLLDHRPAILRDRDGLYKHVYEGNVLLPEPWVAARRFIQIRDHSDNPGFGLITCRPLGGWAGLIVSPDKSTAHGRIHEWKLVDNMMHLLRGGGSLFIQMPERHGSYREWVRSLNATDGLQAQSRRSLVRITKEQPSVGPLPPIPYPLQVIFPR